MTGPTTPDPGAPITPARDPHDPDLFVDRFGGEHPTLVPVAGRFRLVAARACPWAHRAVVVRRLLGLEDALSLGIVGPLHDDATGWTFHLDPGGRDPVLGTADLRESYAAAAPGWAGGVTVPAVVDVGTGRLVTNDHRTLTPDLATAWAPLHRAGAPDLVPDGRAGEIAALHTAIEALAIAPYRAGMAADQDGYDAGVADLFAALDTFEQRLATRRYLLGDTLTEPDVRLWTVLLRFDAVYHGHFRCNRRTLAGGYPALWGYARDLFTTPGFGDTVDMTGIVVHYLLQHRDLNPSGIVPVGPDPAGWYTPHHRDRLGGSPFGDGTPPGPPPAGETVVAPLLLDRSRVRVMSGAPAPSTTVP